MSEESPSPVLVEVDRFLEAANRRDLDAALSFFAPDAVWEIEEALGTTLEGAAAIRDFLEDWFASYQKLWIEQEDALDLGNGVVFAVVVQRGRPIGSSGEVRTRHAAVTEWVEGRIVHFATYPDIDQGRAAAERCAESRG
jgi:ketosteroid isomerase-like protein